MRTSQAKSLERAPLGGPQLGVLDTNTIFNDLLYQLRCGREAGALIRSAREGAVRLFATINVLEEVRRRAVTQERRGFSVDEILTLFESCYLPETRFVDVTGTTIGPRAHVVGQADPDDLPTAQLALLLAPCHVYTDDPHLTNAGFGEARNWLSLAQTAERAMQVDRTVLAIVESTKWAWRKMRPWVERNFRELRPTDVMLGGALGLTLLAVLPPAGHAKLEQAINGGGRLLAGAGEVTTSAGLGLLGERARYGGYLAQTAVAPETPSTLEQRLAREVALRGPLQAAELGNALGADVATIDTLLKSRPCFFRDQQGWWLGQRLVSLRSAT
jgi:predicted nucleic acid-binding protein